MKIRFFHSLWAVAGFVGVWVTMKFLLPLLFPFLLGLGLALAAEPMVGLLHRKGVNRTVSTAIGVTMAFCFLGILLLLLGAFLVRELGAVAGVLPNLEQTAQSGISLLQGWLLDVTERTPQSVRPLLQENVSGFFSDGTALLDRAVGFLLGLAKRILSHVPDSALTLGTGVISAFLISAKLPKIRGWVARKLPREKLCSLLEQGKALRLAIGGWLMAQVKLMVVTLGILLVGFLLLRIAYAPVWALVVALVDALPVLGTGTVLIPWAVICLLQGETARAIGLGGLYLTVALTRSLLEPKLLGRHLGLDPLVTLMTLYAGYKLWGFAGMILAPMAVVTALQFSAENGKSS